MTVGRRIDLEALAPVPRNVEVHPWLPQEAVLAYAAAMLGHGGFGTTMGALALGVPQVVAPLFAFDQVVNGEHVAAVGAGLTVEASDGAVSRAVGEISRLLRTPSYATNAQVVAAAIRRLPPPTAAVPMLSQLAR